MHHYGSHHVPLMRCCHKLYIYVHTTSDTVTLVKRVATSPQKLSLHPKMQVKETLGKTYAHHARWQYCNKSW